MDKGKISVIMAVYNTPAFMLTKAVRSIWNQTYNKIEFIIVNDKSTEQDTIIAIKNIVKEYPETILINNEFNYGLTKSLNIALKHCTGEYIARMDADDVSYPERFMEQWRYLEEHIEVCIVGTQVKRFGDSYKMQSISHCDYTKNEERFKIKMLFDNFGPMHPTVMIRHDFLKRNNIVYREEIKKTQDYALWIDCLNAGGVIKNLKKPLLKYRIHEGQISEKYNKEQIKFKQQIIKQQILHIFGSFSKEYLKAFCTLYSQTYELQKNIYVQALENLIERNREKNIYNEKVFIDEIQKRWIHKCAKCIIRDKDVSGLFIVYTWKCIFSKSLLGWLKERIL